MIAGGADFATDNIFSKTLFQTYVHINAEIDKEARKQCFAVCPDLNPNENQCSKSKRGKREVLMYQTSKTKKNNNPILYIHIYIYIKVFCMEAWPKVPLQVFQTLSDIT